MRAVGAGELRQTEDADALYAELRAKGANLQGEPVSHPWGLRDFGVTDLERNRITFGQPFESGLTRQTNALQQLLETRVRFQTIEAWIGID